MRRWAFVALLLFVGCSASDVRGGAEYLDALELHRQERVERLNADDGWLTLVALHWLEPGETPFGSSPELPLVLPALPATAGRLLYTGDSVRLEPAEGVELRRDGTPMIGAVELWGGEAPVIQVGRLSFVVIERGGRLALRVKDPQSPTRLEFRGIDYFETDGRYHVTATLERFDEPRRVEVPTVAGTNAEMWLPGTVEFRLDDEPFSLQAYVETLEDEELFLIFRDATSGKESYAAARYLYAALDGDRVDLDFNRAYNPPCAFTRFATCPLPPRQNWMTIPVRAGERLYESKDKHK